MHFCLRFSLVVVLTLVFLIEAKNTGEKLNKKKKLSGFIVGRICPNSYLELPQLNGKYTPSEAVNLCEQDLECSGFTYLGAKGVNQPFDIKFFHFIDPKTFSEAKVAGFWTWTSYRVKRNFVAIFHSAANLSKSDIDENSTKKIKLIINRLSDKKFIENFKWKFPSSIYTINVNPNDFSSYSSDLKQSLIKSDSKKTRFVTLVSLDHDFQLDSPLEDVKKLCLEEKNGSNLVEVSVSQPIIECQEVSNSHFKKQYLDFMRPVILNECIDVCLTTLPTLQNIARLFPEAFWTMEGEDGKVKKVASDKFNQKLPPSQITGNLKSEAYQEMARKIFLDSKQSTGPSVDDIWTTLELTKTSQLTIQAVGKNFVTPVQLGSKDTFTSLFTGLQRYILFPTAEKKDLDKLVPCSRNKWITSVYPKIKQQIRVYNISMEEFTLTSNQTLFIPHGWSYLIHALEDSVGIIESKQTVGSIELAAANLPENQIHLLKKGLQDQDLLRPVWRRFVDVLKQRRSPGKYG